MAAQAMRPLKDTHDPLIGYSVDVNNSLNFLQKDLADAASLGTEEQNLFMSKLLTAINRIQHTWLHISSGERLEFRDRKFLSAIDAAEANFRGVCELLRKEIGRDRPEQLKGLPPFK